jgi:hypothetical protein
MCLGITRWHEMNHHWPFQGAEPGERRVLASVAFMLRAHPRSRARRPREPVHRLPWASGAQTGCAGGGFVPAVYLDGPIHAPRQQCQARNSLTCRTEPIESYSESRGGGAYPGPRVRETASAEGPLCRGVGYGCPIVAQDDCGGNLGDTVRNFNDAKWLHGNSDPMPHRQQKAQGKRLRRRFRAHYPFLFQLAPIRGQG